MERDDTSSKRLVLCVSSVQRAESTNPTSSSKQTVLDPEVCLLTVLIISKSLSTFDYLYGYNFEL